MCGKGIVIILFSPHRRIDRFPHTEFLVLTPRDVQKQTVEFLHRIGLAILFGPRQERPIQFPYQSLLPAGALPAVFPGQHRPNPSRTAARTCRQHCLGVLSSAAARSLAARRNSSSA